MTIIDNTRYMAVVFPHKGEHYGLVVIYKTDDKSESLGWRNLERRKICTVVYDGEDKKQARRTILGAKPFNDLLETILTEDAR